MTLAAKLRSALVVTLVLGLAATAAAQRTAPTRPPERGSGASVSDTDLRQARQSFLRGIQLAKQERWADAAEAFERSRQLAPRPSSTFNLASALYRLGRIVDASAALADYWTLAGPRDANRRAAAALETKLSAARAQLTLAVDPPSSFVLVDGLKRPGDGRLRELPMDPGTHVLEVRAEGYLNYRESLQLQRGEDASRDISLEAAPTPGPVILEVPAAEKPIYKKPALWVSLGAIVLAGAAAALAVTLSSPSTAQPYGGSADLVLTGPSAP